MLSSAEPHLQAPVVCTKGKYDKVPTELTAAQVLKALRQGCKALWDRTEDTVPGSL